MLHSFGSGRAGAYSLRRVRRNGCRSNTRADRRPRRLDPGGGDGPIRRADRLLRGDRREPRLLDADRDDDPARPPPEPGRLRRGAPLALVVLGRRRRDGRHRRVHDHGGEAADRRDGDDRAPDRGTAGDGRADRPLRLVRRRADSRSTGRASSACCCWRSARCSRCARVDSRREGLDRPLGRLHHLGLDLPRDRARRRDDSTALRRGVAIPGGRCAHGRLGRVAARLLGAARLTRGAGLRRVDRRAPTRRERAALRRRAARCRSGLPPS